jgi:hypothetical protein
MSDSSDKNHISKEGFLLIRWLLNLPIAKKLYLIMGVMVVMILVELFILWFGMETLSSMRAYVGGEGLWSKAQKDAIYSLEKYADTHDERYYQDFLKFLKVQLGDRKARLEMMKEHLDYDLLYQGFVEGRNHPEDIKGMATLFRRFHNISYIKRAINIWTEADNLIIV